MRLMSVVAASVMALAATAHAAETQVIVARARQHIEAADYRATGKLVTIDGVGNRISYALKIKARWFPGVLRALVEIDPPPGGTTASRPQERVRILLEMRPSGQSTIRIAHPNDTGPTALPFEKWNENLYGGTFSYEDLLEAQYYWQNLTVLKSAKFGARDCDVLKSAPGPSDRTHYAEVETWLDHTIGYPIYAEKTLKDKGIVKQFTYLGLRQTSGVWSASQVEAKVRGRAGSTLLIVDRGNAKANLGLNDFSPAQIIQFEGRP